MSKRYTYEFATRNGARWSVTWHRMRPEHRTPQEIARSVLERWIIDRTTPLPAGRVVVRGRRHAADAPPDDTVARVRVYDRDTIEHMIAPAAAAYLTTFERDCIRAA